jgi:acetylornithine deacetylase/succinyl-diaminopimelate desuccinylase-like protein
MTYSGQSDLIFMMTEINKRIHWERLSDLTQWIIQQGIDIQQIPAPSFHEAKRAAYLKLQFESLGLKEIEIDPVHNVYGLLPGADRNSPGVMISAHTDTVFSEDTDLSIRRETGIIYGPGLGDNSIGVAGMLGLAKALQDEAIQPPCNIWFVATSREEGLGDLGGMKAAYQKLKNVIKSVINIEGLAFGHIYHSGIAVRRLHITATADGGHSWLHFGRESALHGIVDVAARIRSIELPKSPRTTYNIGMIDGGQAINAIATSAEMWLDMRSEDLKSLQELERMVRNFIVEVTNSDLKFDVEVVGDRPAGLITPDHALVKTAINALAKVGAKSVLETGSTDANIALADGRPAITVGITRGGNAHRLDEYIETNPIVAGIRQLILLTLTASHLEL